MNNKTKDYFYSLDLFRGFCGYGVAISHLYAFAFNNLYAEYVSYLFVEFFFVLSGFVLYPQLIKVLNNKKNLITFYKRRWLRTIPLYLVITIAVSVLTKNIFSIDFFKYLFFIQKIFPNFINNDYFPVAWSLSIEELFYLTFPLVLINLNKSNFLFYTFGLILFFIILKLSSSSYVDANFLRTGSILRLDAILIGFVLAHYKKLIIPQKIKIILINSIFLLFYLFNYQYFMTGENSHNLNLIFITLLQIISSLTLISFIHLENLIKKLKIKNLCLVISRQTYSIYLTHIIFIYVLNSMQLPIFFSIIIYIFALFITSSVIYKYFEKPFLSLRPKIN
jgi:peptidoglycan/LPS O-acetylase OafA/YrhL|tara:strand:- start:31 stop:1038 length:1008 start_codon:yes stop_codon:yes gene_type:complete